jgi:energy-coupling factor transporter ATP-binding protein EcfA2
MVRRPEFLILDEPGAELDGRAVRQLSNMLNQLAVTKLTASHRLDFLRSTTSRMILLCEGEVLSEGPTADILNNSALLEEFAGWSEPHGGEHRRSLAVRGFH